MDVDQILAFRLARSGLASRDAEGPAEAADCPASDFSRDAALMALAARCERVTREEYERATDRGELVVAHLVRGAIHAVAPTPRPTSGEPHSSSISGVRCSPGQRSSVTKYEVAIRMTT